MLQTYVEVLKNFSFKGRATRKELFNFTLMQLLLLVGISFLMQPLGNLHYALYLLLILGTSVQGFALSVRRVHDFGWSGWAVLLGYLPLVGVVFGLFLFFAKGQQMDNHFGLSPYRAIP